MNEETYQRAVGRVVNFPGVGVELEALELSDIQKNKIKILFFFFEFKLEKTDPEIFSGIRIHILYRIAKRRMIT